MRCDLFGFLDDLAGRHFKGRAADRHAARSKRAGAVGHIVGIAFDDPNLTDRYAKLRGQDLCHAGGMTLAVAVGTEPCMDAAVGLQRDTCGLEESGPCAQHAGKT
jgi:hypothetical protein